MTSPWSIPIFINLTIPTTAGPGQARIVIASQLPPPLDTFTWDAGTKHYVSGIIFYGDGDDTTYTYLCDAVDTTAPPGNGIVHMGQVASGFVKIDANGDPEVQAWEYDPGTGTFVHRFDSDEFRVEIINPVDVPTILVNTGGLLMQTNVSSILVQALSGIVSIFAGTTASLTATGALGITSNTGKITINAAAGTGDLDMLAGDLLRVIAGGVLQLLSTGDAFLSASGAASDVFVQANGAGGNVSVQANVTGTATVSGGDINISAADDLTLDVTDLLTIIGRVRVSTGGQSGYIPFVPQQARCNVNTLALAAQTLVPGTVINFTAEGTADVFIFDGTWDLLPNVAPTSLFVGTLFIDGVQQGGTATWQTAAITQRNTIHQTWHITGLAAGAHTADIRGASAVANQYLMVNTNSNLCIDPRYRKT